MLHKIEFPYVELGHYLGSDLCCKYYIVHMQCLIYTCIGLQFNWLVRPFLIRNSMIVCVYEATLGSAT